MEIFDLLLAPTNMRAVWNCAEVECGEQSVMTSLILQMLKLSAVNLDSKLQVCL